MAIETLTVPEECLSEVIRIIRAGLKATKKVTPEVRANLEQWCDDEETYLKGLAEDGD